MAIAGFTRTTYKSGGSYATGRVQYITRQGPYSSHAEARVLHQGFEADGAQVREDLVWWNHHNLPQWAHDDPVHFFSAAEKHERAGGVAYTEWRFALPRELSKREQMAAARAFLQASFGREHAYCWALHNPDATDGGKQPHIHVLWSARHADGIERPEEQFFRRYHRAHPERGGAQKAERFAHFGSVMSDRRLYCDVMNVYLEKNNVPARLHPESLVYRGFERGPEPKLKPSDSNALKYHYEVTPRLQEVFDHRFAREPSVAVELADAQRYWQHRKYALGIAREMTVGQQLAHIRAGREQTITRAPERPTLAQLRKQERTVAHAISGLERHTTRVQHELRVERRYDQRGHWRPLSGELRAERVLAEGVKHGLPKDPHAEHIVAVNRAFRRLGMQQHDEPQAGAALNIRLQEREQERDRGIGF